MNYSLNFEYYNEQEKNYIQYVKEVVLSSEPTKYKSDRADFFKTHTYIFNVLTEREKEIFTLYYEQGNVGYFQIAQKYGITRERIRQILGCIFEKLNEPESVKMLITFDDAGAGWDGTNARDFTLEKLNSTYKKLLNKKRKQHFESLTYEQQREDWLLRKILGASQNVFQLFPQDTIHIPDNIYYSTVEAVLGISRANLKKTGNLAVIDKIHALGLHFFWEFEYEEDWVNACYKDIEKVGINDIEQQFKELLRNPLFEKIMNFPVEHLVLSIRSRNALTRNNITTLGDMVKLTAQEYIEMRTLGKTVFNEIEKYLRELKLDMRPEDIEVEDWLQILSRNNYSKAERLLWEGMNVVAKPVVVEYEVKSDITFDNLMNTPIERLNLSQRAYNCLKRGNVNIVKDIIIKTEKELQSFKYLGENSFNEINDKIISLKLILRPKDVKIEDFLDMLERQFETNITNPTTPNENAQEVGSNNNSTNRIIAKMGENIKRELDINKVPEEYRKNYAMGAMANVQEQINASKMNRLFTKAILQTRKPSTPVCILTNIQKNLLSANISDEDILGIVKSNIKYIEYLEDGFIAQYANKLIGMVRNNNKIPTGESLNLIEFIDSAKFRSL